MPDPYLYEDIPVLPNKLDIKTEKTLDLVEVEQSRANMMLLYEQNFLNLLQKDFVKCTGFCLEIFMIGQEITASSISKKRSDCWLGVVFGILMMIILKEIYLPHSRRSMSLTGIIVVVKNLYMV